MQSLAATPELRSYFFDNEALPDDPHLKAKVLIAAETVLDFHEHVAVQRSNLPREVFARWEVYIRSMHKSSIVLAQLLEAPS